MYTSPLQLIVARGVAGAGAAFIMPATLSLLTATHRDEEQTKAVGMIFVLACTVSSSRDEKATPLDWAGAGLIAGAVAVFVSGLLEAPTRGWSHPLVYGSMSVGIVLTVAFGFVELRRRHPLVDVRLFRRPDFTTGSATIMVSARRQARQRS
ncbi:hypothetical protein [Candidatus Mycobacterium methanotrophicum]|uniref:Major facilitator superfamily (MFS) profile domain-containing protein n=1 Tax=Candidatus Mycobacterium methanotrophicum TaxID=2943498 RepID=A0ABY4QLV9_9MYCO|nr:hypothetical protein [Candidatus Mycobacterium methanotrophicum]UQX11591.1 hypothetical protein M5I08_03695 [Candidatus Mycobacterium methanotrophicum]